MHIGKKIRVARAVKGMTQQDLADKIGKTRPLISQIESSGKVRVNTLKAICKALDMDLAETDFDSFFEDQPPYGKKGGRKPADKETFEAMERELRALRDLVEAQKTVIEHLRTALAKKK